MRFIGRKEELLQLEKEYSLGTFGLSIVYGRRRVGKTYLLQEFLRDKRGSYFVATESDELINRISLSNAVYRACGYEEALPPFPDIQEAFRFLFDHSTRERIIFIVDEYPYLAASAPSVSSMLQNLVDSYKHTGKLFLILCGSSMSFMEKQVLGYESPLYGRRTGQIKILPFKYIEAGHFVPRYSERDKALVFALSGGIADYLARFDDSKPLEENIIELFLSTNGRLYEEPSNLLKHEFRDPGRYNDILYLLSTGTSRVSDLANKLGVQSGSLNPYLNNLIDLGIIERKTPVLDRKTKRPVYAISDTMFQFWHAFVQPNLSLINLELGKRVYRQRIEPRINEYMGKVFEKICLQYYERRIKKDMVPFLPEDYGNWWGNDPLRKQESEIDILSFNAEAMLFIECKWRNEKAHRKVLAELVEKSKMFKTDRKFYWIISMSGFHDVEHSLINAEMIDLKQVYSV